MSAAYRIMPLSEAYVNLWAVSVAVISSFSLSYFLSIQMSVTSKQKTWVSLWMPKPKPSFRFGQYKWLTLLSGFIHPSSALKGHGWLRMTTTQLQYNICELYHLARCLRYTYDIRCLKSQNIYLPESFFAQSLILISDPGSFYRESMSKTNGKVMVLSDDKSVTWNYKEACKLSCLFSN